MTSAMALPGPVTVRLALIRTALELYDKDYKGRSLFPMIARSEILISSPDRIGVSGQMLKMLKYDEKKGKCVESIGYREHCHTDGILKVYIRSSSSYKSRLVKLLELVRYWETRFTGLLRFR